jgi:myo-inositol-1(or 4)-monophosphatase
MKPLLNDLTAWARHAGSILRDGYGKRHEINHKGRIDLTTEIDHLSEAYLVEQIHTHFPGHMIDTEESGLLSGAGGCCWYIDPLDGTTNYAHALPVFCVSLAYTENHKSLLGVVYDPMRDECFSAEHGRGAWLNDEPIHVSATSELLYSLLATGFPYDRYTDQRNNLAAFEHFTRLTQGVRRLGAAALDLCYVASGRFEGYWEQTIRPWDIAAGALIVEEAGGRVTKLDGDEDYLKPPFHVLGGNKAIHALMLEELQKLRTDNG